MGLPTFTPGTLIKASEMNQAFAGIVALGDYSLEEVDTGRKWINNKKVYSKTLYFNKLPNNTTMTVPHGIANFQYLIDAELRWYDSVDNRFFTAPRIDSASIFISLSGATSSDIVIKGVGTDWSTRTSECTITMLYTKSTDS